MMRMFVRAALLGVLAGCGSGGAVGGRTDSAPGPSASPADTGTPPGAAAGAPLEDTEWTLAELNGEPVPATEGKSAGFTLVSAGRKVQGSAGCNRMSGTYELDGNALKFGLLATTRMACPEPAMSREQGFLTALSATTRYQIAGPTLTLYGGDSVLARLRAAPRAPS
jgi:heat shock protein HslJ